MELYGVIMAGGGGSRFWPLSRQRRPKQLLNLSGNGLMVNEAITRIAYVTKPQNIFVVTNRLQASPMLQATRGLVIPEHILVEPCARSTAACIGYAAAIIQKKYGDGVMLVTPSDHYVQDPPALVRIFAAAAQLAQETGKLVTIGVTPSYPSTGFGYLKLHPEEQKGVRPVAQFQEKPDEATASQYLASGDYVWNSGMFIWKASAILEKLRTLTPSIHTELMKIQQAIGTVAEQAVLNQVYPTLPTISIDYAVMEPASLAGDVLCIPGEFGWSDVGSWDWMGMLHTPDREGNVLVGDTLALNTTNSILYSSGKLVATAGLDQVIVVETEDAVLVCPKDKAQDVRLIVEALQAKGRQELL